MQQFMKNLQYLQFDKLLSRLKITSEANNDLLILLVAKTGLRFSEALALTAADFDFENNQLKITKAWNYKAADGGFDETKNYSSNRTIVIDQTTCELFRKILGDTSSIDTEAPIFVTQRVFNSTVNRRIEALCIEADIPVVTLHGLRHTHASVLISSGISIASVSKRLGHSNISITQKVYMHLLDEQKKEDDGKISKCLSLLG